MTFASVIARNLLTRRFRTTLTAFAVGIGVFSVVTLGVLTYSLRESAVSILRTGKADFSVAEKHVDDLLNSNIPDTDLAAIRQLPGVESAIGVLVDTERLDRSHPLVIEIGLRPQDQAPFGVSVLQGRSYRSDAQHELMLGYRLAGDLGKRPGDHLVFDGRSYLVTGLFRTGVSIGDSGVMMPLVRAQARERLTGNLTLLFVRVTPGTSAASVRRSIDRQFPQLTTVRSSTDYGRSDRNLVLIGAANVGGSVLAIVIGASGVMNTSLMSFFERVREFGLLRSVGWSRWRLFGLVLGEAVVVSLVGAAIGVAAGFGAVELLARAGSLRGILDPQYPAGVFGRALAFAVGMAFLGATYPAWRAAHLAPLEALRRE
jgi:putative ABC transport system permease protein